MSTITIFEGEVRVAIWPEVDDKPWTPTEEEEDEIFKIQNVESIEASGACGICIILKYPTKTSLGVMLPTHENKILAIVTRYHKGDE